MPPSSLILAVIVAVWAAYVIQHWVRRREHIATARSVDRFSEAMRVLERRQLRPHLDLANPQPRSYSVSLTRPAAPDVVVKRAQPSAPMSSAPQAPPVAEMPSSTGSSRLAETPIRARESSNRAKATGATQPSGATKLVGSTKPGLSAAGVRAVALLLAVLVLTASLLAAASGLVTWWAVPIAAGVGVFALAMVRRSVRQASAGPVVSARSARLPKQAPLPLARRSRRTRASAGGSAAAAFASNLHGERLTSSPQLEPALSPPATRTEQAVEPAAAKAGLSASATSVYDIEAVEQVTAAVSVGGVNAAPVVAESLEPGTWAPVPVPPPTYTLKAKARPRPVHAELPNELPQDGIALSLEEEFEELPSAIRGLA